jgi:hypothetical protein
MESSCYSYQCRACGDNFVLGDERHSHATEVKKAW